MDTGDSKCESTQNNEDLRVPLWISWAIEEKAKIRWESEGQRSDSRMDGGREFADAWLQWDFQGRRMILPWCLESRLTLLIN